MIGVVGLLVTHAASPAASIETEIGTLTGVASVITDAASGGKAVEFGTSGSGNGPGIYVSGNKLVKGVGTTIRLFGINRSGAEYACAGYPGWSFFDGPSDQTSINAKKTWYINALRLPLNEACWLGIDGITGKYGRQNYINAITSFVNLLNSNSIYVTTLPS